MPTFMYTLSLPVLAILLFVVIQAVAVLCLLFSRRYLVPRLTYHDGINEAISGTVQVIGVFYGITVGLIAVSVWDSYSAGSNLAASEAAALGGLYRDVSMFPEPSRTVLMTDLKDYVETVITVEWPAQRKGVMVADGTRVVDRLQAGLAAFEPRSEGESVRYGEALQAFNLLVDQRRLRIESVDGALSQVMWIVIWVGAAISIGVAYFFQIQDLKVHLLLVGLMAGFLALVIFMIVINDRPFFGYACISTESYQLTRNALMRS